MTSTLSSRRRTQIALGAMGLVVGGGIGFLAARLDKSGAFVTDHLSWSDGLAGILAAVLVASGLLLGLASLNRSTAGRILDPEEGGQATDGQVSMLRQQGLVAFLAGAMLATPVIILATFGEVPTVVATATMLAIVAAFLVQTAYNLAVWRQADELMRRVMSETGVVCFWVLQGALFLWAAAEKLGLASALSSWDMMTVLMAFYLIVSSLLSARRGLA